MQIKNSYTVVAYEFLVTFCLFQLSVGIVGRLVYGILRVKTISMKIIFTTAAI